VGEAANRCKGLGHRNLSYFLFNIVHAVRLVAPLGGIRVFTVLDGPHRDVHVEETCLLAQHET
jgi:hypothetical protein